MSLSFCSFAQKPLADCSLEELQQQKGDAVAQNKMYDTAVYTKAINLRTQMDAATKTEDFTKAATLKQQLKSLKLISPGDVEKINKLEEEIKKAVAAEDYAKAGELKKQVEILKGNKPPETLKSENTKKSVSNSAAVTIPAVEFVNQVYFWNKEENSVKSLEYDTPELKTETNVGFGYAQATSFWCVQGTESDVRLTMDDNSSFILKVAPGVNPVDLFRFVKFEILGKISPSRHMAAYTSTSAAYAGSSTKERREHDIPVSYKKLDESYYEVVPNGRLSAGEYTFYGLGKMFSFSLGRSFVSNAPPANTDNQKSSSTGDYTSKYNKNDIYNESNVTWFGVDFSLFTYTFMRKEGKEAELLKHIDAWQRVYDKEVPDKKLAQWLKKPGLREDKDNVESLYRTMIKPNWINSDNHDVSMGEIQNQLGNYKTGARGIGLVLIPELFNEDKNNYVMEFVWFDIDSKTIITSQKIYGKGSGGATLSGWNDAMTAATKMYVDKFYRPAR
jgi:hypothetical protein